MQCINGHCCQSMPVHVPWKCDLITEICGIEVHEESSRDN